MLLQDRVAIITGGGQGIGLGIAETFCRAGARVVIGELVSERGGKPPRVYVPRGIKRRRSLWM